MASTGARTGATTAKIVAADLRSAHNRFHAFCVKTGVDPRLTVEVGSRFGIMRRQSTTPAAFKPSLERMEPT
jgi:hypothetical protein